MGELPAGEDAGGGKKKFLKSRGGDSVWVSQDPSRLARPEECSLASGIIIRVLIFSGNHTAAELEMMVAGVKCLKGTPVTPVGARGG